MVYFISFQREAWRRKCAIWLKDDEKEPLLDVKNMMKTAWSFAKECLPNNKDPRLRAPGSYTFIVSSAFRGMNTLAGFGWLCMDSNHMVCEAISHPIRSSSSLETELMAIRGISEALNSYNAGGPIRILSDCELAVSILKGVTRPPPQFISLVGIIRGNFTIIEVEFMHVCEKFTSTAHRLACLAAFTGNSQCWKDEFPEDLIDSVANSFD